MVGTLHLLGSPRLVLDGTLRPRPRGRKVWALLAYLAVEDRSVTRERAAGLLFGEAEDPLGALRWTLAEARRLLGEAKALAGDDLALTLPAEITVDVQLLTRSSWVESERVALAGGALLEGLSFPANPAFDAWLSGARHHVNALQSSVLRQAVLGRLATGDAVGAVAAARRLVAHDPFDEPAHTLLVRSLVEHGSRREAEEAVERCDAVFREHLGLSPTAAVAAELERPPTPAGMATPAAARAALDAGTAAVAAGAAEVGIDRLREAAARAADARDLTTEVAALCELGYALVHSVRGRDEAGAVVLARAIALADRAAQPALATAAHRELGYVACLGARYVEALVELDLAEDLADGDEAELAAVAAFRGACFTDVADYAAALPELQRSVALARASGSKRWIVWASMMLARYHLLRRELGDARPPLEDALANVLAMNWTSVVPWPEALLAEVDLHEGSADAAHEAASHAFALGCDLADPCWQETAGRVLGLVALERGDVDGARAILVDARDRGARSTDAWQFAHAEVLDALAALAGHFVAESGAWIHDLELVAGAGGMREMLVRSHLHRAAAGQTGALDTARKLAEDIDNPALTARLNAYR